MPRKTGGWNRPGEWQKMENGMTFKRWLPVVGLTCAAFIFNTSEFVPIGLLSDIAVDFGTTETRAGMLISVYAWMVMLLSLPLMLLVSKMELRRLMLITVSLFTLFQVLSFASADYGMLMLSRIGVACTHAVFWSVVSPLAVQLVPDKYKPAALSMIVTGTSVAMIFGLPLGRVIGLQIGWRMTFLCVGIFSFATLIYLLIDLPKVSAGEGFSVHRLPQLLRNPALTGIYLLMFVLVTGYYTGYSYIEPFLKQVAHLHDNLITATLMIFGAAGILGSLAFSKFYHRNPNAFVSLSLAGVAVALWLLAPATHIFPGVIVLCALWGTAVTALNVAMQSEVIACSPQEGSAVAMSIYSGIFNLGIACGTMLGGSVCLHASISHIGYVGGVLAVAALVYWRKRLMKIIRGAVHALSMSAKTER